MHLCGRLFKALLTLLVLQGLASICLAASSKKRRRGPEGQTQPDSKKSLISNEEEFCLELEGLDVNHPASLLLEERGNRLLGPERWRSFPELFDEALSPASRAEAMVDYFRLIFNREVRNMLRKQLKIASDSPSLEPGSSVDGFLEALISATLPLPDERLKLFIYKLCSVLGRMARGQVARTAWQVSESFADTLDELEREKLYEVACGLLLFGVDYYWLPGQTAAAKDVSNHLVKLQRFLFAKNIKSYSQRNPRETVALDISKWIVDMFLILGPPSDSVQTLNKILEDKPMHIDKALSFLATQYNLEALNRNSYQHLMKELFSLVAPSHESFSLGNVLRRLQFLRVEFPKMDWFYAQHFHGDSLEQALETWTRLSRDTYAALNAVFDVDSRLFGSLLQQDPKSLVKTVVDEFGRLVSFQTKFAGMLVRNGYECKVVDPQTSLVNILEEYLRSASAYVRIGGFSSYGLRLGVTNELELDLTAVISKPEPILDFLGQFLRGNPAQPLAEVLRVGEAIFKSELEAAHYEYTRMGQLLGLATLMGTELVPQINRGPIVPENARLGRIGQFLQTLLARWQEGGPKEHGIIRGWINSYTAIRKSFLQRRGEYLAFLNLDEPSIDELYPDVLAELGRCESEWLPEAGPFDEPL